jgi:hypothetical protein
MDATSFLFSFKPEGSEGMPSKDLTAPLDDDLAGNPRYQVYRFHSKILPDDRAVQVYLPP